MKSKTLTIRPMVATDLQHLNVPTFGASVRGQAIELDGVPVGVAGVLHQAIPQAFSVMSDDLRKHPKMIVKFIKQFESFLERNYTRVFAVASSGEKNAPTCLRRAGFEFVEMNRDGQEVFQWEATK